MFDPPLNQNWNKEKLKMEKIQKSFKNGVIIGRFQVDELTDGHKDLISRVKEAHERTIVILGLSPCRCTVNNPLDFQARKGMIQEIFPDVDVLYIYDVGSDLLWSDTVDSLLENAGCTSEDACLYGSRDSFIPHYSGKFQTKVLEQVVFTSGTQRRKELASKIERDASFRRGVIWATMNSYPVAYSTVDIAIFNENDSAILLGRKEQEKEFRFIGGFTTPGETHEDAAIRETTEEAGVIIKNMGYVKSFVIDDWRYRSEASKITTALFETFEWEGKPCPGDDICELRWFPFNKHTMAHVVDAHKEMFNYLLER